MPYGVANSTGKPNPEQAEKSFGCVAKWYSLVDTAQAYGESENVLAAAFNATVVTVSKSNLQAPSSADITSSRAVRQAVLDSLQRLGFPALRVSVAPGEMLDAWPGLLSQTLRLGSPHGAFLFGFA